MLRFDPSDPFPLLAEGSYTYADTQIHAEHVDRWLGLNIEKVESQIVSTENQELWVGLPVRSMLTPYIEIRALLDRLKMKPDQTLVDLGAGYGRIGFVIARHYPDSRFIGHELSQHRVRETARLLSSPAARIECSDLSSPDFKPEEADFYFIYDYGTRRAIEKTLADLREIAAKKPITVIGRGRSSRDAIEQRHPWLSQMQAPVHTEHYSIYRS